MPGCLELPLKEQLPSGLCPETMRSQHSHIQNHCKLQMRTFVVCVLYICSPCINRMLPHGCVQRQGDTPAASVECTETPYYGIGICVARYHSSHTSAKVLFVSFHLVLHCLVAWTTTRHVVPLEEQLHFGLCPETNKSQHMHIQSHCQLYQTTCSASGLWRYPPCLKFMLEQGCVMCQGDEAPA